MVFGSISGERIVDLPMGELVPRIFQGVSGKFYNARWMLMALST